MELILIVLTSTIICALCFAVFVYGREIGRKEVTRKEMVVDDHNVEALKELSNWLNFKG